MIAVTSDRFCEKVEDIEFGRDLSNNDLFCYNLIFNGVDINLYCLVFGMQSQVFDNRSSGRDVGVKLWCR